MTFWIVAGLLLAACIVPIASALRARPTATGPADVAVYRDQLAELKRDAARGTLPPEEVEAARAEVGRRLLAADRVSRRTGRRGNVVLGAALIATAVLTVSVGTYLAIGAPGYGDLPLQARIARIEAARADRPDQQGVEAGVPDRRDTSRPDIMRMAEQLKTVLADRPDDLRGWRLGVQTYSGLGDLEAAWRAQERVVSLLGDAATGEDYALQAELMVLAAGGYVSPEAERALAEALRRDPANGTARYYAGLMYAQGGRPDLAWRLWRRLIADSPEGAPWLDPIYAQIEDVSVRAGDPTALADLPRPRGPSPEDVEAAADMTPEQRFEMIEGMVTGLARRLADQGGPAADWARLITAYGVLGQRDAAAEIYAEARTVFADDRTALDSLARAAEQAGIAP
ncbi:c-type cytochrome biogenesis protein CcmI [Jannaschia sp. S6380]|uniref:c-type cytochrome biogenesis protein CcmI n=1 Tax=Jannaschia sp. S6380 TaxID=2926408 RepID=UPI001FF6701F|nr:c-type cytochrome biogenesis protein CcmI [Jannaschia sp. S6380]MCK0166619.1 c-type cytochrome biogenesis protein CcmI [Jannaschia sp. S6380]